MIPKKIKLSDSGKMSREEIEGVGAENDVTSQKGIRKKYEREILGNTIT